MGEHPILFSGPMVRAILEDRKTQTRRVIKPQFNHKWGSGVPHGYDKFGVHVDIPLVEPHPLFGGWAYLFCKYGKVRDRLWVRESLRRCQDSEGSIPLALYDVDRSPVTSDNGPTAWMWKHSVLTGRYMPRWASRIMLEITGLCVEPLHEISEEDAIAEGCAEIVSNGWVRKPTAIFAQLWDSINAKRGFGWDVNPWVWVIEFKRID